MRHNPSDAEWRLMAPILPGKPPGVLRVDDRCDPERFFPDLEVGSAVA